MVREGGGRGWVGKEERGGGGVLGRGLGKAREWAWKQ